MRGRAVRLSHILVRCIAIIILANLGVSILSMAWSHAIANVWSGGVVVVVMLLSLSLPFYVAFEGWWMLRDEKFDAKAFWIDAVLAASCFLGMGIAALCGLTRYFMI